MTVNADVAKQIYDSIVDSSTPLTLLEVVCKYVGIAPVKVYSKLSPDEIIVVKARMLEVKECLRVMVSKSLLKIVSRETPPMEIHYMISTKKIEGWENATKWTV